VAHGLAQAGHLDLDDLGPQLAQVGAGRRPQDILGAGQPPITFQSLGFIKERVLIEDGLAIFFKR